MKVLVINNSATVQHKNATTTTKTIPNVSFSRLAPVFQSGSLIKIYMHMVHNVLFVLYVCV